jgi:signal peptidase I
MSERPEEPAEPDPPETSAEAPITDPDPGVVDPDPAVVDPDAAVVDPEARVADSDPAAADPEAPIADPATSIDDPATLELGGDRADLDDHAKAVLRWRMLSRERHGNRHRRGGRPGKPPKKKRPWWVELPILIVIAFLATFLIQTFVARVYYVPSGSMEKTLHGVQHGGDRILAYKLGYDFGSPEQGDVVVFKGPATWAPEASLPGPTTWLGKVAQALGSVVGVAPANEKDFVKRVIAVGGQTISCCDAEGRVQVDGVSLTEPYLFMDVANHPNWEWLPGESSCAVDPDDPSRYRSFRCFGPYTVPKNTVWVMGDHRSDSADSTWNCRGLVPADNVHCQGPIPVEDVVGRAVAIVMPPSRWGGVGSPDIMSGGADKPGSSAG